MSESEGWTIGRLLEWTTDYLRQHGADNPRLDAEVLLAHARHCKRIELYTSFEDVAPDDLRASFRDLVRQRAAGMPVAYLVGHKEFYSLDFAVTPEVLIPRPETEFVVITVLELAAARGEARALDIADVGTGSGAIAISLARHLPAARLIATDISRRAIEIARKNAEAHGVSARVQLLESDLLSAAPDGARFDVIASNPPYVTSAELADLPGEVKDREPRLALDGGASGTAVIERLIPEAAQRLHGGGSLVMEISPMLADRVTELIAQDTRFAPAAIVRDMAGLARVVHASRK